MSIFTDARKRHKLSKPSNEIATFEAPKSDIIIQSQAWCELMLVFLNGLCVAVKYLDGDAFLLTAYLTDKIKKGELLWQQL